MTARLLTTSMGILLLAMVFSLLKQNAKNWNQIHESPWTEEDIQASLSKFDFWLLDINYVKKKKFCELNPSDVACLTGASGTHFR